MRGSDGVEVRGGVCAGGGIGRGVRLGAAAPLCAQRARVAPRRAAAAWTMGKKADFGPFTPVVVTTRIVIGEKRFNALRGKGISLHSQVIGNFCGYVGASGKTKQGLIRLAKNNGSKLGFLS
ncbi:Protein PROTON GRADIENT REGULATION 5, chloroplastic [Porphyridium purpureum]|uniref:Protein PROTON GRADIENT REGULATION 5, chloroplastic n=1 Tax=Porphyridium purpureum TaxID=35688 RepID=A0A5J4YR59_PORPP|nr:Protein PROTON GRADIENT REGULATION 5, chloroplastic [Porphyridium purpureum]|eukprot:POR5922..scf296_7